MRLLHFIPINFDYNYGTKLDQELGRSVSVVIKPYMMFDFYRAVIDLAAQGKYLNVQPDLAFSINFSFGEGLSSLESLEYSSYIEDMVTYRKLFKTETSPSLRKYVTKNSFNKISDELSAKYL